MQTNIFDKMIIKPVESCQPFEINQYKPVEIRMGVHTHTHTHTHTHDALLISLFFRKEKPFRFNQFSDRYFRLKIICRIALFPYRFCLNLYRNVKITLQGKWYESLGTCSGLLRTCSGLLGTRSGLLETRSGLLRTRSGLLETCSGLLGTRSGSLMTLHESLVRLN